jgi:hypothetical protein
MMRHTAAHSIRRNLFHLQVAESRKAAKHIAARFVHWHRWIQVTHSSHLVLYVVGEYLTC